MKFQVIASWGRMKVVKMSKLIMNLKTTELLLTDCFACFSMSIRASTFRNSIWRNTQQSPLFNWGMRFVCISECFELSFSFWLRVKPSRTCYTSFVHKGKKEISSDLAQSPPNWTFFFRFSQVFWRYAIYNVILSVFICAVVLCKWRQ